MSGQDILHVDVYDEDSVINEKLGSLQIDLHELYAKGSIDQWFELTGKVSSSSYGQIHLRLEHERLRV